MSRAPRWRLELLGKPRLVRPDGQVLRQDGTALALVAYLALEGPTPRSRLAGLLWPETPEGPARNNLVHLIRRCNKTYGEALLHADDSVSLSEQVWVDASLLLDGAERDDSAPPVGALLEESDFDDRPDLADWLLAWRERLDSARIRQLTHLAARQEEEGNLTDALTTTARLIDMNPVSEDAWRRLARLHYLTGDRGAALAAFERCRAVLQREFGAEPLPETLALAREVERGALLTPVSLPRPRIPLSVLRPPSLIGREAEWARMEVAWEAGQFIILAGEGGVGKSRLARDFAASKGEVVYLEGRPGDALVPYSTTTRNLRRILARTPDLPLEPWVRASLSRLLPEMLDGAPAPSEPDARLHAAILHVFQVGLTGVSAVVYDDLHLADLASIETGGLLISSSFPLGQPGNVPRLIATVRLTELPGSSTALFGQIAAAGQSLRLDLEPLGAQAVGALLRDLDVPQVQGLGTQLARFTGGNPLFLLETVKHLIEAPRADGTLPVAARVSQLIEGRLARLSPAALGVARGAAVLQSDVRIEIVAAVLGMPLLDTAAAWEELEAAQVMAGERFSHDLVQETVLAGIPQAVRRLLNRSAARVLPGEGGSPARVARHWLEGGDEAQAAPWLVRAAEAALASFRLQEASSFFVQAAEILRALGEKDAAFTAHLRAVRALLFLSDRHAAQAALDELLAEAVTPEQRAQAWWCQAEWHVRGQDGEAAERAARAGLEALGERDAPVRARLMAALAAALSAQDRLGEATLGYGAAVALLEPSGSSPELARTLSELAVTLDGQDRHLEARPHHERACAMLEALDDRPLLAVSLRWRSDNLFDLGHVREGLHLIQRAFDLEAEADAATWGTSEGHAGVAQAHMDLGEFGHALTHFERAIEADTDLSTWRRVYHGLCLGELWQVLGAPARAWPLLAAARDCPTMPGRYRSRAHVAWSALPGLSEAERREVLLAAEQLLHDESRPLARLRVLLAQAAVFPAGQAHDFALRALALARAHQLGGFEVAALTRAAQTASMLRRGEEAQDYVTQAALLLSTREPAEMTRGEVYWTQHLVWRDENRPDAAHALQQAVVWVRETCEHQVPLSYQEGFLRGNSLVRRILEAADLSGHGTQWPSVGAQG